MRTLTNHILRWTRANNNGSSICASCEETAELLREYIAFMEEALVKLDSDDFCEHEEAMTMLTDQLNHLRSRKAQQ